jgi:acetyl-CoA acetyltransferase
MRDVYVTGAYTTVFKKHPGLSFGDLSREAYMGALADAGKQNGADIETGWLGNFGMGFWGQNSIRAQACSSRWSNDRQGYRPLPAGLKQACCGQTYVSTSNAAATGVIKNKTLGEIGE